jgi:hypothetical protein
MDILDCKRGDVVCTGDSYGYELCVCLEEFHPSNGLNVVTLMELNSGMQYESGYAPGYYGDYCELRGKMSEEEILDLLRRKSGQ